MSTDIVASNRERLVAFHSLNGRAVGQREDGYVDGTALCRAEGRLIADYLRLGSTRAFLAELSGSMGIPIDLLIDSVTEGSNDARGTWVHPLVAYNLGQWCSPKAAVFVSRLLHAIHTGTLEVRPRPALPGPELALRTLELAERILRLSGTIEPRDQLLLKDRARNLLCDGRAMTPASAPQRFITISARCEEFGLRVSLSELQQIGKGAARLYRRYKRQDPTRHEQFVDGAVRQVATYSEEDLDMVDAAIEGTLGVKLPPASSRRER
jgi:hypothetical protein